MHLSLSIDLGFFQPSNPTLGIHSAPEYENFCLSLTIPSQLDTFLPCLFFNCASATLNTRISFPVYFTQYVCLDCLDFFLL